MTASDPANDNEGFDDYETFTLDISFDELLDALRANGANVKRGMLTEDGDFVLREND